MVDVPEQRHPSFGVVEVGRVTGSSYLFQSEARHQHFVRLAVRRASVKRDLSREWVFPDETLVEVYMTQSQWATFISSMNLGGGTPCTIHFLAGAGEVEEPPPPVSKGDKFVADFRKQIATVTGRLDSIQARVAAAAENPRKAELRAIARDLSVLAANIPSNLKFIRESFEEDVDDTLQKAVQEIEGFFAARLQTLGLEAGSIQPPVSLPEPRAAASEPCPGCGDCDSYGPQVHQFGADR